MAQANGRIIANVDRLNQYMDKNGLEAVAIRSGINFTYLAPLRGRLSFAKTASSPLGDDLCFSRQAEREDARR